MADWHTRFLDLAQHIATWSKDTTKVGAVAVGPNREVLATGYNGPPRGVEDRPERFVRPAKYLFASHAEMNLIAHAARHGISLDRATVYVTHHPCSTCARLLIQAGIRAVVVGGGTTSMPADEFEAAAVMFREARVGVTTRTECGWINR